MLSVFSVRRGRKHFARNRARAEEESEPVPDRVRGLRGTSKSRALTRNTQSSPPCHSKSA